jgi:hypothetical protein
MFKCSSNTRFGRISGLADRVCSWGRAVLILFMIQHLPASDLLVRSQSRPESVAFARYIASLEKPDPFTEGGPVALLIESSLPHLYKDAQVLAIRRMGENERSEYGIVGLVGDGVALHEATTRYLAIQEGVENLPLSSIQISPENYRFRLRGEVKTGIGSAYVYDITPRKRRPGLFKGQIWIEAWTGAEVLSFTVPLLGRSELVVTERPLGGQDDIQMPQAPPKHESSTLDLPNIAVR